MLRNRTYRGEIVHKGQSHPGEHTPIIDQPLWDAVQIRLAVNTTERTSGTRTHQPSLLAGMLFDTEGNRMTPSYAVEQGRRYRYYVSRRYCQLKRPWYARRVGGAAARVGELVCLPIMLPAQAERGRKRRSGSAKLTMPYGAIGGIQEEALVILPDNDTPGARARQRRVAPPPAAARSAAS